LPFSGNPVRFFCPSEIAKFRADAEKPTVQVG